MFAVGFLQQLLDAFYVAFYSTLQFVRFQVSRDINEIPCFDNCACVQEQLFHQCACLLYEIKVYVQAW